MQTRSEWQHKQVPMRQAAALDNHLQSLGLPQSPIFTNTGISRQSLHQPDARITYQQFITLLQNLLDLPVPGNFFLNRAENFSIADYGILGYAMMSSATMGQAIQIATKYHQTIGPAIKPDLIVTGASVELRASNFLDLADDLLLAVVEDVFSSFPPLLKLLTGNSVVIRAVRFSFPNPRKPMSLYSNIFGCEPEFNCSANSFVMDADILDAPLVQADANAARLLEKSCQEMLEQLSGSLDLAGTVQHMLLNSPRPLNAAQVADKLNIGVRTLRRRLAIETCSFQELSDQVRRRLAIDYLAETRLSNQEIGELLGFTEATNFRRAFLRWTGQTPKAFRSNRGYADAG